MTQTKSEQLVGLSEYLAAQRDSILAAWRKASDADPEQTTVRSLTRGQFNDHIPEVLDAFEHRLRSRPGGREARAADRDEKEEEGKHGLHRWQQGYRLKELIHEWGHLQLCLFEEFETYADRHPEFEHDAHAEANRQMIALVNEAISGSAGQYERLQKAEAAGHVRDLETAVGRVNEIERRRARLIHQAVHDLRGNVQSVNLAAMVLGDARIAESDRVEFATLIQQGTQSVAAMLGELMELARLEAGQERRELVAFDAGVLIAELGGVIQPTARERGLFLKVTGPSNLPVEGDPGKVRRLLQNLVLNALKYTVEGGVVLSWGEEKESWWVMVKDTGPGLLAGPGAPMVVGLKEATASARESDEKTAATAGETSHVLAPPAGATTALRKPYQQPGEGIGLSIVKRICELLDASLEMASSAEAGTTFRIVLPRHYQLPPAGSSQAAS
ncbi:MAG TPA: HAMP domain-containing sensor histidine kinase [Lacunisphaera sp.]|nr:HAMP domain-containing sensor histidine kinase [Lacunisphaera sp.]